MIDFIKNSLWKAKETKIEKNTMSTRNALLLTMTFLWIVWYLESYRQDHWITLWEQIKDKVVQINKDGNLSKKVLGYIEKYKK